jgi:hypothetical protein
MQRTWYEYSLPMYVPSMGSHWISPQIEGQHLFLCLAGTMLSLRGPIKFIHTFHPQTDGQTERVNQTLEQFLRIYVNYQQDNWVPHLPLAEFTYNNTHHNAVNMTLFYANKGFHPTLSIDLLKISHLEAQKTVADLNTLHCFCQDQIKIANDRARLLHRYDKPVGTRRFGPWETCGYRDPWPVQVKRYIPVDRYPWV